MKCLFLVVLATVEIAVAEEPVFRTWTTTNDASVVATALYVSAGRLVLQKPEGSRVSVRLDSLSRQDLEYLASNPVGAAPRVQQVERVVPPLRQQPPDQSVLAKGSEPPRLSTTLKYSELRNWLSNRSRYYDVNGKQSVLFIEGGTVYLQSRGGGQFRVPIDEIKPTLQDQLRWMRDDLSQEEKDRIIRNVEHAEDAEAKEELRKEVKAAREAAQRAATAAQNAEQSAG